MSIKPQFQEQAQEIAIKRPQTFKNWQEVIRLAIHYGLPEIGRIQERERLHQAAINMRQQTRQGTTETRAMRGIPVPPRICKHTGKQTTDCPPGLYNCKNCDSMKK